MMAARMKICPSCGLVYPEESNFCFLSGDSLRQAEDPVVGTTIDGRFRVDKRMAVGPLATHYAGRERLLKTPCVLKVWRQPPAEAPRAHFSEAVAQARRSTHPNVSEVVGGGITEDGIAYTVRIDDGGKPLSELLAGRMAPPRAFGWVLQLARALGRIHDFGVVHGALRPSNVLAFGDHLEVIDVGLGRSLFCEPWEDDPSALGAQHYLAPELSSQERSSAPADIYALGVIAFQLIAGELPIAADNLADLRSQLNHDAWLDMGARLPALPVDLRGWLQRVLQPIPGERPSNAHQALEELVAALEKSGIQPAADPGVRKKVPSVDLDATFERWQRFGGVFTKMIELGFPSGAPPHTRSAYDAIVARTQDLSELGKKALYEHNVMSDVVQRAREGRQNIASQMDELNASAKLIRVALQPVTAEADRHGDDTQRFPEEAREQHREIMRWEGRSALTEPYRELSEAYRKMADIIDAWWSVRSAQLGCEQEAAEKGESLRELEAQLEELRQALRIHESNLSEEVRACEQSLSELGKDADRLELELLDLASRFTAPLRSKPELGACFRDLAKP
jgi:serine/threonine-protein kinase